MKYSDLPRSQLVGFAADPDSLQELFEQALTKQGPFIYCDRAVDGPRSCRILFQEMIVPYVETRPLDQPHSTTAAAHQFFQTQFLPQVRRSPTNAPSNKSMPGWEVRKTDINGRLMVIVLAEWLEVA